MQRVLKLLAVLLLAAPLGAQTVPSGGSDDFGGWKLYSASHPHAQSATCSQSATTQSCTVTNGAVYAVTERINLLSCGNPALNYVFTEDSNTGASRITAIAGNSITLTSDSSSQTVGATSCTFSPAKMWTQQLVVNGKNRSIFLTPEGHPFVSNSMTYPGCGPNFANCSLTKYPSECGGVNDQMAQWATWNINSIGQADNDSHFDLSSGGSCSNSNKYPEFFEQFVSSYAAVNLNGVASAATINLSAATTSTWGGECGTYRQLPDVYASQYGAFVGAWMQRAPQNVWPLYPGTMGILFDDITYNLAPGGGADFHSIPAGKNDCDPALIVLDSAPVVNANRNPVYTGGLSACNGGGKCVLYTDSVNHSKAALASYLQTKYVTVAALNTAWSTSYSSFGSQGTQVTGESIGTGDGVTVTFTHTLASLSASPFSVGVYVGGVLVAGDCAQYTNSGCTASAGTGLLVGPTISSGSVNYSTGALTITFSSAPANASAITVNYVQNGYTIGTGFLDESGNSASIGTNAYCLIQPPAFQTNHAYTAGTIIHDATSGTWQAVLIGGTSGASAPAFSTTQGTNVVSGTVAFQSEAKPVCGSEVGSDFAAANMNQTMAADLTDWEQQFDAQMISSTCGEEKTDFPDTPCGGFDTNGDWFAPPRKPLLLAEQAAGVDWIYTNILDPSNDPNANAKWAFDTQNYQGPIISGQQFYTSNQNQGTVITSPVYSTLALMGAGWYALDNWVVSTVGATGIYQGAGTAWGSSHNITGCTSCGLKDDLDNAYDGNENVVASVNCSPPNSGLTGKCGGETVGNAWVGQNAIGTSSSGLITNGNCLWSLCGAAPSSMPVVPAPTSLIAQVAKIWKAITGGL